MEAFITPPDPASPSDPLTRLLAAILHWLQDLLAQHQAGLLPPPRARRASPRKSAEKPENLGRIAVRPLALQTRARRIAQACPRAVRLRDMTTGLPRPRLVAPS